MARYIDADKIVDIIKTDIKQCEIDVSQSCGDELYEMAVNSRSSAMHSILSEIASAPTADVAEVVRCKNCRYAREDKALCDMYGCTLYRDMRKGEDFCNHGERKAQE